jgi:hypothetical protein
MPAYGQAAFLGRAVGTLQAQTLRTWELVVVDDGSPDDTADVAAALARRDARIRVLRREANGGLGAALNAGLDAARAPLVAYLPCDDLLHREHLASLVVALQDSGAVLAHAELEDGPDAALPARPGALQLVQILHRRTADRWIARPELESDDLERLLLDRLRARGPVVATGRATCRWSAHPGQRHRALLTSRDGGPNVFRGRYGVRGPLRIATSDGEHVDEHARYARFAGRPPPAGDGLRILLVGELAYNPERILALEERGHRLFGLWTPDGLGFNTVGPLPFGHVEDLPRDDLAGAVRRARPDVIYALLNWRAVPFAHRVLGAGLGVPFVWHVKEAPQRSVLRGEWPLLAELHLRSDAQVYSTAEERDWFEAALPGRLDAARSLVLDGDLPKRDWLDAPRAAARMSAQDGAPHVAVLGRPVGLSPEDVAALARAGVHLHVHGLRQAPGMRDDWLALAGRLAPSHLHAHRAVEPGDWVSVLSRYDAGLLHRVAARNDGDVRRATWDDLNCPARVPTLLAAGLPLLQPAAPGQVSAMARIVAETGAGLLYEGLGDLAAKLRAEVAGPRASARAWAVREEFTFDAQVDRLVALLTSVAGGG